MIDVGVEREGQRSLGPLSLQIISRLSDELTNILDDEGLVKP